MSDYFGQLQSLVAGQSLEFSLASEDETQALGAAIAQWLQLQNDAASIFLVGNLGAGKTTLSRGILRGFGHTGAVKSPTYTLVENYEFNQRKLYHFDLYRLGDPEELEYMGIRDYFVDDTICLIEWPERGEGVLQRADLIITISVENIGRRINLEANFAL